MSQTCSNCGFVNKATNRFCSNCGVTLAPASSSDAAAQAAPTASPPPPAGSAEPVTYLVQTWDSPEPTPATAPAEEEKVVAPPRPTFVPYGSYSSTASPSVSSAYSASSTTTSIAPPPVSPSQGDGGMYSAYSPEAARRLEAQKPQRSWLLPSVGAAALLLLVLIVVGGFLLLSPGKNPSNPGAPSAPAGNGQNVPSGSGNDQDTIKAVIKQSNDEQIAAWRNLDTSALGNTRTGQVLQDNIQAVQDLKNSGLYAIPVNKSLEYGNIAVTGNTATAKTVEVWTVTFYSKDDNKVVNSTGPDTLYETYHLVKQNGKWLVSTLDIVENSTPTVPTPVPGTNNT